MYNDAEVLKTTWLTLAQRHQWALIDDVDVWINGIQAQHPEIETNAQLYTLLLRAYSARLYQGCVNREEQAFKEVWVYCSRIALRQQYSQENIEDIIQETLALVIIKLSQLRHPESFLPWVAMILRSVIRSFLRVRQKADVPLGTLEDTSEQLIDSTPQPEEAIEQKAVRERLLSLLDQLKSPGKEILTRSLLFDERVSDTARELGLNEAYVRVVKHRALKHLRLLLGDELRLLLGDELDPENRSL